MARVERETLLITGAAGRIGGFLRQPLLAAGYRLRLMDLTPVPDAQPDEEPIEGSVTDADLLSDACRGAAGVVHLGGLAGRECWPDILHTNIHGTWQVLEAARAAGVPRVVLASSNHAVGFAPQGERPLPDDTFPRPDTYYGVSKVTMEALGSYFTDAHGMHVVCLRIGTCREEPPDERALSTWLSPGDAARLVLAALTTDNRGFHVVWGVSANTRRWWSTAGGEAIGYRPEDDAERYAATLAGAAATDGVVRVGGPWALPARPGERRY